MIFFCEMLVMRINLNVFTNFHFEVHFLSVPGANLGKVGLRSILSLGLDD